MARLLKLRSRRRDSKAEPTLACRAPFASLHLDQMGDARPCCQSTYVLGNVAEQDLGEIWSGERAERLRDAIADGDLSLGCGFCEWSGRSGGHEATYARRFDEVPLPEPGAGPTRLEVAPSNTCNLQCTMCNGEWSSSIRSQREKLPPLPKRYDADVLESIAAWLPGVQEVELFGGEPLLAREARWILERLLAEHPDVEVRITTNGTIWDDRVQRFVEGLGMNVVVSIDGASQPTYESIRVGSNWDSARDHLDRFRAACDAAGSRLDLAHCLMVENWWELPELLALAAGLRAPVFINTVLSPAASSLHHLSPPELHHVVRSLEGRRDEVVALGDPWLATYDQQIELLRTSLDDASKGRRHQHLGDAELPDGREVGVDERLLPDPARTVRVEADEHLVVERVEVVQDDGSLPPLDLEHLVGRPSSAAVASNTTRLTQRFLRWDEAVTVEEQVHSHGEHVLHERRTVDATGRRLLVEVWQRVLPGEDDLRRSVAAKADDTGAAIEIELDPEGIVTAVGPADAAGQLGVSLEVGDRCHSPTDALSAEQLAHHPQVDMAGLDPLTNVGRITFDDGRVLVFTTRQRYDGSTLVGTGVVLASATGSEGLPEPTLQRA